MLIAITLCMVIDASKAGTYNVFKEYKCYFTIMQGPCCIYRNSYNMARISTRWYNAYPEIDNDDIW